MGFTRKASKMYGYIQGYKYKISNGLGEMFFAPLSKKIVGRLKKRYDNKIPVDKIIAFCDTSVFIQAKRGIVFTEDGFYHKFIGTPIFISYKSIDSILIGNNGLEIHTDNYFSYTLTDAFNYAVLKSVLLELKSIDNAYGQNESRESGKITEKSVASKVGKVAKGTAKVAGKVVVAIIDDMLETAGSTKSAQERVRKTSNNPGNTEKEKIRNEIIVIQLKLKEAQNKIRINDAKLNIKQEQMKNLTERDNNEEVTRLNDEIKEIRKKKEKLWNTVSHLESQMELLQERLDEIEDEN